METSEIYSALKTNVLTKDCIANVVPIDQLPDPSNLNYNNEGVQFLVINLDTSDLPGSHWVAVLVSPAPTILNEYFDSYGLNPPGIIEEYLGKNFIHQKKSLQSHTSTICGQWCIYYILYRCKGYTMRDIVAPFREKSKASNDDHVNKVVNEMFTDVQEPLIDKPFTKLQISRQMYS